MVEVAIGEESECTFETNLTGFREESSRNVLTKSGASMHLRHATLQSLDNVRWRLPIRPAVRQAG